MSKIKVEPKNLDLAEKVIEACGEFIVKKASEFIKTLFVSEDEEEAPIKDEEQVKEKEDVQGI